MRLFLPLLITLPLMAAPALAQEEVGAFSNDWTGNGVVVQAFPDPGVQGVTCHVASFSRSLIDRMTKGNWFEDPSNSSIACRQTGPIVIGDIETDEEGEDIFSERRSLIFKSVAVRRIWDQKNQTMVYVVYSRQVKDASAKLGISTVPLFGQDVRREE